MAEKRKVSPGTEAMAKKAKTQKKGTEQEARVGRVTRKTKLSKFGG